MASKITKKRIAEYWFNIVDEAGLSVDFSEATRRCWRCGVEASLERCHIIPDSLGGTDSVHNLVLLCERCHIENPNVEDQEIMWDWLKAYGTPFYDTFWLNEGFEEYELIYGKSLKDEFRERHIGDYKVFNDFISEAFNGASYHFGHPNFNRATIAGVLRMALKKYDNSLE